ncbi:MAG: ABC transporter ATP-binding protein, partial [Actinobacteria bacterium]|nr:ABC transporter ATP-binding protein [Actinomycetota bacterium]
IYVTHDQVEAMTMGDRVAVMSMGVLLQVDRPQQLYDEPANLFVASFIGTPPMNLFRSALRAEGDGIVAELGDVSLPVGAGCMRRYAAIRAMTGRNVVIGIRAEDIYPAAARPDLPTLDATVELLEALGSGVMAYFHVEAESVRTPLTHGNGTEEVAEEGVVARPNLIAHFPPRIEIALADTVPVAIDTDSLHFFDEETGAALR